MQKREKTFFSTIDRLRLAAREPPSCGGRDRMRPTRGLDSQHCPFFLHQQRDLDRDDLQAKCWANSMASMASRPRRRAGNDLFSFDDIEISRSSQKEKNKNSSSPLRLGRGPGGDAAGGRRGPGGDPARDCAGGGEGGHRGGGVRGGGEKGMELKEKRRKVE